MIPVFQGVLRSCFPVPPATERSYCTGKNAHPRRTCVCHDRLLGSLAFGLFLRQPSCRPRGKGRTRRPRNASTLVMKLSLARGRPVWVRTRSMRRVSSSWASVNLDSAVETERNRRNDGRGVLYGRDGRGRSPRACGGCGAACVFWKAPFAGMTPFWCFFTSSGKSRPHARGGHSCTSGARFRRNRPLYVRARCLRYNAGG